MTHAPTNLQHAQLTALERAAAALVTVPLAARCSNLGLPALAADGALTARFLDRDLRLTPPDFPATLATGVAAALPDHLLLLHYLLCPTPIAPTGTWITFRDLPGGQFYHGPFCNRSTRMLSRRIGDDLPLLRANLARFDHAPLANFPADLAVKIRVLGRLDVALLYHLADDTAPASADLLFDACIKSVYQTEDVAVLASRLCLSLCQPPATAG